MNYETIDQIYDANKKVRQRLKDLVARLTETQITALPDGEKWTVAQIVEHISMVDEGLREAAKESGGRGTSFRWQDFDLGYFYAEGKGDCRDEGQRT